MKKKEDMLFLALCHVLAETLYIIVLICNNTFETYFFLERERVVCLLFPLAHSFAFAPLKDDLFPGRCLSCLCKGLFHDSVNHSDAVGVGATLARASKARRVDVLVIRVKRERMQWDQAEQR